jgi:acyl carrier protein
MLTPEQGLAVLEQLLRCRSAASPQAAALRLDLERISARMRQQPVFEMLLASASVSDQERKRRLRFLEDYRAAPSSKRRALMLTHLQSLVAGALGIDDAASIPRNDALFDLGLDSLTSLELRNAMEASLQVKVPATLVFDHTTLADLADHFSSVLSRESENSTPPPSPGSEPAVEAPELAQPAAETPPHDAESVKDGPNEHVADLIRSIHELSAELDRWEDGQA